MYEEGQRVRISENPVWVEGLGRPPQEFWGKVVEISADRVCEICGARHGNLFLIKGAGERRWSGQWFEKPHEIVELSGEKAAVIYVNVDERKKTREVSLSDLVDGLASQTQQFINVETPILPVGTKYYRHYGELELIFIEQPPQVRTVKWKSRDMTGGLREFRLAFPFVIFAFGFTKETKYCGLSAGFPRCFYRNSPLTSLDDELFKTNLENVGSGQYICMGNLSGEQYNISTGLNKRVEALLDKFWHGEFNGELTSTANFFDFLMSDNLKSGKRYLDWWEEKTAANPLFILETEWHRSGQTIRTITEGGGGILSRNSA